MRIDIDLSADSFLNAAKQLREYADSLSGKSEKLVEELGEYGLDNAANSLGHFDTGETLSSLEFNQSGASGTISVGGAAVWIEFGTGVTKNSTKHPKASELGMSDWGTYRKGHGADPNGWWYPGNDGKWHHTFGITSNQFMYSASQDMRRELKDIAREVFKSD